MSEENITITLKEYKRLRKDSYILGLLEGAGVDNWQGYDFALEEFDEDELEF